MHLYVEIFFLNILIPWLTFCAAWDTGHLLYSGQDILVWSVFKAQLTTPEADGSVIPVSAGHFYLALRHHSWQIYPAKNMGQV